MGNALAAGLSSGPNSKLLVTFESIKSAGSNEGFKNATIVQEKTDSASSNRLTSLLDKDSSSLLSSSSGWSLDWSLFKRAAAPLIRLKRVFLRSDSVPPIRDDEIYAHDLDHLDHNQKESPLHISQSHEPSSEFWTNHGKDYDALDAHDDHILYSEGGSSPIALPFSYGKLRSCPPSIMYAYETDYNFQFSFFSRN